ncbi:MAG: hypothetical protein PVI91_02845 [Gammaproteobacteria bacterium]|jgi:hypothetical protein
MKSEAPLAWIGSWVRQCLLTRAPQDDPLSHRGLTWSLLAYALVDLLQAGTASSWPVALGMTLTDTLIMVVFTWLVLLIMQKPARLMQTLTALAGTGAMLGLLGMPLMLQASRTPAGSEPAAALVMGWLALLVWSIAVQAHIFRHALSSWYGVGLLVAGLHTALAIVLLNYFFPQTTG